MALENHSISTQHIISAIHRNNCLDFPQLLTLSPDVKCHEPPPSIICQLQKEKPCITLDCCYQMTEEFAADNLTRIPAFYTWIPSQWLLLLLFSSLVTTPSFQRGFASTMVHCSRMGPMSVDWYVNLYWLNVSFFALSVYCVVRSIMLPLTAHDLTACASTVFSVLRTIT